MTTISAPTPICGSMSAIVVLCPAARTSSAVSSPVMPAPMITQSPLTLARPTSTSSAVTTFSPSMPGIGGLNGWAPLAMNTPQGESALTFSVVASSPSLTSIPCSLTRAIMESTSRVIFLCR